MHPRLFPTSCLFLVIVFITHVPTCLGADDEQYTNCSRLFQCGSLSNIGYPFWGGDRLSYCGDLSFGLTCVSNVPEITIESITYRVLEIDNTSQVLTVARNDYWNTVCPTQYRNASLDTTHFSYGSDSQEEMMLYYDCRILSSNIQILNQFNCTKSSTSNTTGIFAFSGLPSFSYDSQFASCNTSVSVQVNKTKAEALASDSASASTVINVTQIMQLLDTGFVLRWEANDTICDRCVESGGRCGSNSSSFACYCPDQAYDLTCGNSSMNAGGGNAGLKIALPIAGAVVAGVGLGWIIFSCRQRRKRISAQSALAAQSKDITSPPLSKGLTITPSTNFTRSIPSYPSSNSDFGKSSSYFGVQVFSYTELEEATNNFDPSRQLGEGGFGTVYYGQLQDGRVVAVKRLFENNFRRVEQFMNEVEILTRLRHENLVTLFGCTSRRSRELLLVYEYIPNGTVADHVHGKRSNSGLLSWPVRLSIAIETANALAYLHESDIIHRDVKTNNILLDNDFRVKVADFGLSRLFPTDVTHVSTAPQGTPGYVDPEYYQCYQLTEKSDVYSFGVVLIELISSKQAVDTNRNRHDINLANMAINKIQNHTLHELVDPSLGFETNNLVRRMTTLVAELAFRCLQMERDMRPSMQEVRDALKGIKNEEMNAQQAEVVDIVIEDDVIGLLKGNPEPRMSTSDSTATEKLVSSSTTTPNSSA